MQVNSVAANAAVTASGVSAKKDSTEEKNQSTKTRTHKARNQVQTSTKTLSKS